MLGCHGFAKKVASQEESKLLKTCEHAGGKKSVLVDFEGDKAGDDFGGREATLCIILVLG